MVSLLNSTCARFDDVVRSGARYELEAALLYVKGTWLPSEFSISVCDGNDAWTGRATEEFVVENANRLGLTESEYVDRVQFYFSKQQPHVNYELKWGKSLSPELICSLPQNRTSVILKLQTTTDSGPRVAADMVQLLLDAHHGLTEELAKKTRGYEREIAAKERSLTLLGTHQEGTVSPRDRTNGHVDEEVRATEKTVAGTSSRVKRKAGASNTESRSRKRPSKASEPLPLLQKTLSPAPLLLEQATGTRPPPLSALGYRQQSKSEARRETSKDPSWLEAVVAGHPNGVADDSLSEGQTAGGRRAFLDRLSDVAEPKTEPLPARKSNKKRPLKSGGKRSSKKAQPQRSLDNSLDQVEDVVEKGIHSVDKIAPSQTAHEVSSLLTPRKTPGKPQRKTPASGKGRASSPKETKEKKKTSSRSSRKKVKPTVVELEAEEASEPESEPSEAPEIVAGPNPGVDNDREIDVVNAEFSDFDASRSEGCFEEGQFWALYDDQDGMPRFYGHVTLVQNSPLKVSVEWLEPFKPNCPASGLVKTAKLSPSCGEFTFGSECLQDLPAFSHIVEVERDAKRSMVTFWPKKDEIWALYREWEKKQAKKEDGDQSFYYEYDLVQVASNYSSADGLSVLPLIKVEGFKSLFTVADEDEMYNIPHKHVQGRFSHCIPRYQMIGSESPGVPPGAWELDPASTPAEYLGTGGQEGNT